jgi:putative peptidoglycan lipid II flippase
MSRMLKSSGAMGAATLTSRVLGMVREIVYANFMGDSAVAGAFKLAFKVPNLFRRLLGEGALTAAFIPIFKDKEKNAGEAEMWRAANAVISGLIVASAAIIGLVLLGVSVALAVGEFSAQTRLMLELLRVMFPYLLLVCLTAIGMGMLNARGHFFIPAMGATMLNVVMIASVLWLVPTLFKEGFRYRWVSPFGNDTVRQVVQKMIPATIGVAAFQINVLLTDCVAFVVNPQIVASFDYAVRLMELPQGVFGISLATFLLPTLAGLAAEKNHDEFRSTLDKGLEHLWFFNLPAAVFLGILAEPIVRLLFQHGAFDDASTERAAAALRFLAPGLLAFSAVNILARAFFALGDTQTPMRISVLCLGVNVVLAMLLVFPLQQAGLALANTVTACLNAVLLTMALRQKLEGLPLMEYRRNLLRSTLAVLGSVLPLLWAGGLFDEVFTQRTLADRLKEVFGALLAGGLTYWVLSWLLRVNSAREITAMLLSKLRKQP